MTQHHITHPWLQNFIGKPFCYGKSGPDAFDCWGLVKTLYRELFQYEINTLHTYPSQRHLYPQTIYQESLSPDWNEVQSPIFGNLALFFRKHPSRKPMPEHIGMVLPYKSTIYILHAIDPVGVVCEPLERIDLRGLHLYNYYRPAQTV